MDSTAVHLPRAVSSESQGMPTSQSTSTSTRRKSGTSPRTNSKSVLTIALQKAQSAVLLDAANNVPAAIAAYKQAVRLLGQVMDRASNDEDRSRLRHIVGSSKYPLAY